MRQAFTLIELIFVIVIIGLLAAVAVPKFTHLKSNAQASSIVKNTVDAAQQAVETAVNKVDLDDNSSFQLSDIVKLDGKGWSYSVGTDNNGSYEYNTSSSKTVSKITLYLNDRKVEYSIDCNNLPDTASQDKCKRLLGDKSTVDVNLTY